LHRTIWLGILTVLAVIVHVGGGFWLHDMGTAAVLLCVNLFALAAGAVYARSLTRQRARLYVAGHVALFVLVAVVAREPLLFAIFGLLYAAVFRSVHLLGYLVILVLSLLLVPMYWFQSLVLTGILYAVVLQVYRQRHRRLAVVYFAAGFALLVAVLPPILYLALQSSPQTLLVTAGQGGFVTALANSFLTATVSTLVVLVFGVAFAYGMARLEFRGKEIINSLIDLPILIPQSVVGIGLLVVLGPKAPLGELLREHLSLSLRQLPGNHRVPGLRQLPIPDPRLNERVRGDQPEARERKPHARGQCPGHLLPALTASGVRRDLQRLHPDLGAGDLGDRQPDGPLLPANNHLDLHLRHLHPVWA
jgi:ABC-type glycerol-3-phosphate transport system permease component